MLPAITWLKFVEVLVILTVLYEIAIIALYFRSDLKKLLWSKGNSNPSVESAQRPALFSDIPENDSPDTLQPELFDEQGQETAEAEENEGRSPLFPIAYELVDELKQLISDAEEKKIKREELIFAFQLKLTEEPYLSLKNTPFRVAINNYIETECENHCKIRFTGEELVMLWNR